MRAPTRRAIGTLIAMPITAALALSVTAAPAAAHPHTRYPTLRYVKHVLLGETVTDSKVLARSAIVGWTGYQQRKVGTMWYPTISVSRICRPNHPCPTKSAPVVIKRTPHGYKIVSGAKARTIVGAEAADSYRAKAHWPWYEFWHWHWVQIMGRVLENLVRHCLGGAGAVLSGAASERFATWMVMRAATLRAAMTRDPRVYVVVVIAGCVGGITWGEIPQ